MPFNVFCGQEWDNLRPLTHTRPVGDLRIGITTIAEKWADALKQPFGYITRPYLQERYKALPATLHINGSVLPDKGLAEAVLALLPGESLGNADGKIIALRTMENAMALPTAVYDREHKVYNEAITAINFPEDLFLHNREAIERDYDRLTAGRNSAALSTTNTILGDRLFAEPGAEAECSTFDTRGGAIYLGKNSKVMEGCHIKGPFALCDNADLKMGTRIYGGTTAGPYCRLGGEINNSVFWGYSAKSHDGYMGNSVLGQWCNMGAGTSNSNLKNNYSPVKLYNAAAGEMRNTGLTFCGTVIADHVKCGINTMINTGTVIGVGCNIFGGMQFDPYVKDFTWVGPDGSENYQFDKFLKTAETVMLRKEVYLDDLEKQIYAYINNSLR